MLRAAKFRTSRALLLWLVVTATVFGVLRLLNSSATQEHGVDRFYAVMGMFVTLTAALGAYSLISHGYRHPSTILSIAFAVLSGIWVYLRWVSWIGWASMVLMLAVVVCSLRSQTYIRAMIVVAFAMVPAALLELLTMFISGFVIHCDRNTRWVCEAEGLALFGVFALGLCFVFDVVERRVPQFAN